MKKVLFSGELPPNSINGISYSNEINIKFLKEKFNVYVDEEIVDLKLHKKKSILKFSNFLNRIRRIFFYSLYNRFSFFYIVFSASTAGAIKTLSLIVLFKIFNFSSRIILHVHRSDLDKFVEKNKTSSILFNCVLKLTDKVIVLSGKTKEFIETEFKQETEIFVLNNTVSIESSKPKKMRTASDPIRCIYISNYIEEKGILILLEAFSKLNDNFELSCFGNYSDLNLKSKILSYESNKIKINEAITGAKKFQKIAESDLLLLPSFNEGKPLILLESMMTGTPFISRNIGYIPEMVGPDYPFFYGENNVENLTYYINKFSLITEPEKLNLSKKLQDHYFSNYSHELHKLELFKIFDECI